MLAMKPHEGEASRKTWDIVDDLFDLGLVLFVAAWVATGAHFDENILKTAAMTGASVRIASRRIFRAILGPRINAWVKLQQIVAQSQVPPESRSDPSPTEGPKE